MQIGGTTRPCRRFQVLHDGLGDLAPGLDGSAQALTQAGQFTPLFVAVIERVVHGSDLVAHGLA